MSGTVRRAIIVIAASVLVLGGLHAAFGQGQVTVTYLGETPDTGSSWYAGANASALWDYVYTIDPTAALYGPTWFFVVTEAKPDFIYTTDPDGAGPLTDPDGDWTGSWTDSFFYPSTPAHPLDGQPGVLWLWPNLNQPTAGIFHFASIYPPTLRPWTARGLQSTIYNGDGETWSAQPEPASMALTGLCLFGVAAWKRRRMGLKKD